MDPQILVGLAASLFGGSIVALITFMTNRQKVSAEVRKIDADVEKTRAETQKVLKEVGIVANAVSLASGTATPKGWYKAGSNSEDYSVGIDREISYVGATSGYIEGSAGARGFGTMMQSFKADKFRGERRRLSAFVRTEGLVDHSALWMRVDGPEGQTQSFDNMDDRPIKGNTGWRKYCIVLNIPSDAKLIAFGIILSGSGRAWIDAVRFDLAGESEVVTGELELPTGPVNTDFDEFG